MVISGSGNGEWSGRLQKKNLCPKGPKESGIFTRNQGSRGLHHADDTTALATHASVRPGSGHGMSYDTSLHCID